MGPIHEKQLTLRDMIEGHVDTLITTSGSVNSDAVYELADRIWALFGDVKVEYGLRNTVAEGWALSAEEASAGKLKVIPAKEHWHFEPFRFLDSLERAEDLRETYLKQREHLKEAPRGYMRFIGGIEVVHRLHHTSAWAAVKADE